MQDHKIIVMYPIDIMVTGGAQQQLLELVRGIDKTRFKPLVVTLYPGGALDQQVRNIPEAELLSLNRKGKFDFWILIKLLSLLRRYKVDVIQPFLTPATFFGLISSILNHTHVKIVTERSGAWLNTGLGYRVYRKTEDFLTRFADRAIPNSEAGRALLINRGINPDRIKVIYNGINLKRLTPDKDKIARIRQQMNLPADGKVAGITATLTPAKDHATFLQAARIIHEVMPQTRFAILGDGPLRQGLESMARELGIESCVTFFGNQPDVGSYISVFDVSCLCSVDLEGCSNATLEAMALGKPAVVTDIGGNRELVEHGKTGFLVPVRNPEAMAEGILTLFKQPDLAQEMGQCAREMVLARFSFDRMVRDYEQIYEQALQLKRRG